MKNKQVKSVLNERKRERDMQVKSVMTERERKRAWGYREKVKSVTGEKGKRAGR